MMRLTDGNEEQAAINGVYATCLLAGQANMGERGSLRFLLPAACCLSLLQDKTERRREDEERGWGSKRGVFTPPALFSLAISLFRRICTDFPSTRSLPRALLAPLHLADRDASPLPSVPVPSLHASKVHSLQLLPSSDPCAPFLQKQTFQTVPPSACSTSVSGMSGEVRCWRRTRFPLPSIIFIQEHTFVCASLLISPLIKYLI